jgi:hypothetical protein
VGGGNPRNPGRPIKRQLGRKNTYTGTARVNALFSCTISCAFLNVRSLKASRWCVCWLTRRAGPSQSTPNPPIVNMTEVFSRASFSNYSVHWYDDGQLCHSSHDEHNCTRIQVLARARHAHTLRAFHPSTALSSVKLVHLLIHTRI